MRNSRAECGWGVRPRSRCSCVRGEAGFFSGCVASSLVYPPAESAFTLRGLLGVVDDENFERNFFSFELQSELLR